MHLYFLIYVIVLNSALCEALFFSFADKPIFYCLKVCPLYCSKRMKRSDEDSSALVYIEDNPYFSHSHHSYSFSHHDVWDDGPLYPPYPYGHFVWCKPKTTTTPKPTTTTMATTTEEPTFICEICKKKCDYPKS